MMIELKTIQDVIEHGGFDETGRFRLNPGEYVVPEHIKLPSPITIGHEKKGDSFGYSGPISQHWVGAAPSWLTAGKVIVEQNGDGYNDPDPAAWARAIADGIHCQCCPRRAACEQSLLT